MDKGERRDGDVKEDEERGEGQLTIEIDLLAFVSLPLRSEHLRWRVLDQSKLRI